MDNWNRVSEGCPEGKIIETCIIEGGSIRMQQRLIRKGRLFFFTDMSMYVYYTPTHWRYF